MREPNAVTLARSRRESGEALSTEERELLREYDAQYRQRQVKLSFTELRIAELRRLGQASGYFKLAPFLKDHAERSLRGEVVDPANLRSMERELQEQEQELQILRRRNAQMQIELDRLTAKITDYADQFVKVIDQFGESDSK